MTDFIQGRLSLSQLNSKALTECYDHVFFCFQNKKLRKQCQFLVVVGGGGGNEKEISLYTVVEIAILSQMCH